MAQAQSKQSEMHQNVGYRIYLCITLYFSGA